MTSAERPGGGGGGEEQCLGQWHGNEQCPSMTMEWVLVQVGLHVYSVVKGHHTS